MCLKLLELVPPSRRTLRDDKRAAEAHLPFSRIAKGFSGWVALEHKEKYGGLFPGNWRAWAHCFSDRKRIPDP